MKWSDVGNWIKKNAGTGAKLVGSLITGNAAGAIAAGVSLVSSATGTDDPAEALAALQQDPQALIRLKELYYQNEQDVRQHLADMARMKLEDLQHEHATTQKTIQTGDTATDEFVRRTRPTMARESWLATVAYCLGALVYQAFTGEDIFALAVAGVLSAPAWAYLGLRTGDKFATAWKERKGAP